MAAAVIGHVLLTGSVPHAVDAQFVPLTCTPCGSGHQNIQYDWTTTGTVPSDPNCAATVGDPCPHYIPNFRQSRLIVTNPHVSQLQFNFDRFETEASADIFRYGLRGDAPLAISGNPSISTFRTINATGTSGLQGKPATIRFESDSALGDEGIELGTTRVCCSNAGDTGASGPWLSNTEIADGYLLGTNDVVRFRSLNFQSSTDLTVVLQTDNTSSDFEIYARCNAHPTPTSYTLRTTGVGGHDRILHLANGSCPAPSTWHIVVKSDSGAGQFTLRAFEHYPSDILYQRVGIGFSATATQINAFKVAISQAAREYFGATEGSQQLRYLQFFNNAGANCDNCGGVNCDICFSTCEGTGACCDETYGWMVICQDYYNSTGGIMHEFVHKYSSGSHSFLGDEYSGSDSLCGHSVLNVNPFGDQNNLCFGFDHEKDRTPGAASTGRENSLRLMWLNAQIPFQWNSSWDTPDNYDYVNFDFNGRVGNAY